MSALFAGRIDTVAALLLLVVAVVCAITDLWKGKIYNAVTYPTLLIGLILQVSLHGLPGLWSALGGFAVGFFPAFLLFALGGMGGGDVKLMAAIGAVAGVIPATETLVLAFFFGGLLALGKLAWNGQLFRTLWYTLRVFVGYVVPGLGHPARPEGSRRLEVRFGVAICLGLVATLWDVRTGAITSLL